MEYLAERVNDRDYATAAFGKLHHYPATDTKGFRHVSFMEEGRLGQEEPYLKWLQERHPEVSHVFNTESGRFRFGADEYYEHWIASEAIDYLEQQHRTNPEQPFLAWISFQGPHTPLDPPREAAGTVDTGALPRPVPRREGPRGQVLEYRAQTQPAPRTEEDAMARRVAYAEMIVEIDRQVGRIIDALEELGLFERTTFIFSADHGDLLGDQGQTSKGPFPYRGQLDIPLILSNHPDVAPGTRSDQLAGNIDIPGTVLAVAGAERGIGMSRSLIDLASPAPSHPREVIYSEFCDSIKTVDSSRYRFSYYPLSGVCELYDKETDPDEQVDLAHAPAHQAVVAAHLAHVVDFMVLAKGLRVEAQDFTARQRSGALAKDPHAAIEYGRTHRQDLFEALLKRMEKAGLGDDTAALRATWGPEH